MNRVPIYCLTLITLLICISNSAHASPATMNMLDDDGCHVCMNACNKFGVSRGQKHCHVFYPEAVELKKVSRIHINLKTFSRYGTREQSSYGSNLEHALEYISTSPGGEKLLLGAFRRDISGTYDIINQSCGFGKGPVILSKGPPADAKELFDAKVDDRTNGLYTMNYAGTNLPLIGVGGNYWEKYVVVTDPESKVICSGQAVRGMIYLYCKADLMQDARHGGGMCSVTIKSK